MTVNADGSASMASSIVTKHSASGILLVSTSTMPAVDLPCKVLVSGANGYIAMWIILELLKQGYLVRGTVRSASKGQHPKKEFIKYGDKFEVAIVEDITKVGFILSFSYPDTVRC